ncbi:MAG TPA: two-component system response regulator, partial [bacterium]|nr:two-component system response regulator [bacterium]
MERTVLVVDDAAFMRATLKDIFARNGYRVVGEARNG